MSRMFYIEGKPMETWNVFVGCRYECSYCNARKAAETRFRHITRYKNGFKPHLVVEELNRYFTPGHFVLVAYMGDISFASRHEVDIILEVIQIFHETTFLFLSKNPACYSGWRLEYPDNLYLGATIESNVEYGLSKAPAPYERYKSLAKFDHLQKFVSIEPIMDFDLGVMVDWMKGIKPGIIEVGADNYKNNLPEPAWWKVNRLLSNLKDICPKVVEKAGLKRLKGEEK